MFGKVQSSSDKRLIRGRTNAPPLSLKERYQIQKFLNQNYSCSSISRILGRGKNTIVTEVRKNSVDGKYSARTAHEKSFERKELGYQKAKNHPNRVQFKPGLNLNLLNEKIQMIENQLGIIVDVLKEMKGKQ